MNQQQQPKLKVNPIVKRSHYIYYFDMSPSTAYRSMTTDKKLLEKNRITFEDFYLMYEAFPCPKFNPIFKNV